MENVLSSQKLNMDAPSERTETPTLSQLVMERNIASIRQSFRGFMFPGAAPQNRSFQSGGGVYTLRLEIRLKIKRGRNQNVKLSPFSQQMDEKLKLPSKNLFNGGL